VVRVKLDRAFVVADGLVVCLHFVVGLAHLEVGVGIIGTALVILREILERLLRFLAFQVNVAEVEIGAVERRVLLDRCLEIADGPRFFLQLHAAQAPGVICFCKRRLHPYGIAERCGRSAVFLLNIIDQPEVVVGVGVFRVCGNGLFEGIGCLVVHFFTVIDSAQPVPGVIVFRVRLYRLPVRLDRPFIVFCGAALVADEPPVGAGLFRHIFRGGRFLSRSVGESVGAVRSAPVRRPLDFIGIARCGLLSLELAQGGIIFVPEVFIL